MSDQSQQAQLEDLKYRVDILEKAEIRLRVQSVGPRGMIGPPGHHAEKGEKGDRGNTGSVGPQGPNGQNGLNAEIDHNTMEAQIIQVLRDFGIVSDTGPIKKFVQDTSFVPFED
jgi:hypothetical protein